MDSEKDAVRQDEDEEGDDSSEDFPEGDEEIDEKKANSLTGVLNAKIAALAIASLVIGILIGQVALPGLGIGLVSLPSAQGNDNVDLAALQAKVQGYLEENFKPQGIAVDVTKFEEYNDELYLAEFKITKDGQDQLGAVYVTKSGKSMIAGQIQIFLLDEPIPAVQQPAQQQTQQAAAPPVVGTLESFKDSGYTVELQDGKPVIRLFSTTWCPHCIWIKPTFDRVVKEYADAGKIVAYHWEVDTFDNTLTEAVETAIPDSEMAVYGKFNPGGSIPSFVLGGRYYRVGNGFEGQGDTANPASAQSLANLAKEEAAFRAVIGKLIEEAKQ